MELKLQQAAGVGIDADFYAHGVIGQDVFYQFGPLQETEVAAVEVVFVAHVIDFLNAADAVEVKVVDGVAMPVGVFIDEGDKFVASEDFAKAIKNTDNYYVIATRTPLFNLPYSVKEIYGIKNVSGNRFQGTKRLYAEFYPLCRVDTDISLKPDLVITEDSKSGYRFFENYFSEYGINCVSAASKTKIYNELITRQYETVLVIADGAAFGPEIQRVLSLRKAKNIVLFLPESFEWVILRSGIVKDKEIKTILEKPYDYIESGKYFSWERFFTAVLTEKTKDTYLEYDKSHLNKNYINPGEKDAILSAMPEIKL